MAGGKSVEFIRIMAAHLQQGSGVLAIRKRVLWGHVTKDLVKGIEGGVVMGPGMSRESSVRELWLERFCTGEIFNIHQTRARIDLELLALEM
jgi:hypothetical protein